MENEQWHPSISRPYDDYPSGSFGNTVDTHREQAMAWAKDGDYQKAFFWICLALSDMTEEITDLKWEVDSLNTQIDKLTED